MLLFIADSHCDTLYALEFENISGGAIMSSKDKLEKGGVSLQTFALFAGSREYMHTPYENALRMLKRANSIGIPFYTGNLPDNPPDQVSGIFSIEGGQVLEGKLERLFEFDRLCRIRMISLTWNYENEIGYPAKINNTIGLKPFGLSLLMEMDRLGIYADVSHLNEAGFWDVCENAKLPPIASHSNAYELADSYRNLKKNQIEEIIKRNGYIGVNFYPYFLTRREDAQISDIIRHIDYIASLGGIDVLGLGSDFDGIEVQPEGLKDASQMGNLIDALLKSNYTEDQVKGIAGMNFWWLLKNAEVVREQNR